MQRRTLLQVLAAVVASGFGRLRLLAQPTPVLTDAHLATLRAMAEAAFPSALSDDDRAAVVRRFVAWIRNYREGADMGHGYGSGTIRRPSGPSPARTYPAQFEALDEAASGHGAASFAALPVADRRAVIAQRLDGADPVTRLPSSPQGDSLVADFLGFYFNSPEAWDLCYQADVDRERCRGLEGTAARPARPGGS